MFRADIWKWSLGIEGLRLTERSDDKAARNNVNRVAIILLSRPHSRGSVIRSAISSCSINLGREHEGRDHARSATLWITRAEPGELPALGDQSSARRRTRGRRISVADRTQTRSQEHVLLCLISLLLNFYLSCWDVLHTIFCKNLAYVARMQWAMNWLGKSGKVISFRSEKKSRARERV